MTYPLRSVLLTAACLIGACHRDAPAPQSQVPATPSADTAQPAASAPAAAPSDSHPPAVAAVPATKPVAPAPSAAPDPSAPAPLRDAYHTAPLDTVDAKTYQGWKYYNLNCARCHGEDVLGTTIAPHLILSLKPNGPIPNEGVFLSTVCGGRPEKGMPAWCSIGLSTAQIDTIYAYVKGRSDAKLHPGRPARR